MCIRDRRNTNTRQFRVLGPDTGFDSIGDPLPAASLIALLDGLEAVSYTHLDVYKRQFWP